jgi:hypothetical protein
MYWTSSGPRRKFTGTSTRPLPVAAQSATRNFSELGETIAIRSPAPIPIRSSASTKPSQRRSSSP